MDQNFIAEVEKAGWLIKAVDMGDVLAGCPRAGCALTVRLKQGAAIPQTCRRGPDLASVAVNSWSDAATFLRKRRDDLGLSIKDVEEVAGAATDHFAKAEKDNPTRIPNAEIFIEWAGALGYSVVLVPGQLTPYARRVIAETRKQIGWRKKMQPHHAARRERRKEAEP